MKKIIIAILIAMLLAVPTACSANVNENDSPAVDTAVSEADISGADISASDAAAMGDAEMKTLVEYAPEFASYPVAATFGSDGWEKNIVWCECDITDVRVYRIEYDVETMTFETEAEPEYTLDSLKAGDAILLDFDIPEIIPNRIIMYKAGDTEYTYELCYNGRDGGIALVPVEG